MSDRSGVTWIDRSPRNQLGKVALLFVYLNEIAYHLVSRRSGAFAQFGLRSRAVGATQEVHFLIAGFFRLAKWLRMGWLVGAAWIEPNTHLTRFDCWPINQQDNN